MSGSDVKTRADGRSVFVAELLVREAKLASSSSSESSKKAHEGSERLTKQLCSETEALMDRLEFLNNKKLVSLTS